jgi:phosphoribosylcarboxyaminoimidazole (NCAIR) mutase
MIIGIVKIFESAKATFSLIIAGAAFAANLTGHLDSNGLAAVISTVSIIFMHTHAKTDCAKIAAEKDEKQ